MRASRNLIPAAALAAACVHAQAVQVQLYGIVDAGIESTSSSAGRQWRALSGGLYGSRWGVTGSEDLGAGRRAVFRLESGFAADDGSFLQGGRAFGRESSVGVASDALGTLLIGRLPTPYYLSQSAVDAFAWGNAGSLAAATAAHGGVGPRRQRHRIRDSRVGRIQRACAVFARRGINSAGSQPGCSRALRDASGDRHHCVEQAIRGGGRWGRSHRIHCRGKRRVGTSPALRGFHTGKKQLHHLHGSLCAQPGGFGRLAQ
jgi:hypothetical protein